MNYSLSANLNHRQMFGLKHLKSVAFLNYRYTMVFNGTDTPNVVKFKRSHALREKDLPNP